MSQSGIAEFFVGFAVVLGFFGLLAALIFYEIPASNRDVLNQCLGALTLAFGGIVGYYFGSSKGSAAKTALLAGERSFPQDDLPMIERVAREHPEIAARLRKLQQELEEAEAARQRENAHA